MTAYYNENDKFAAQWLRELIKKGMIAPGEVDERSILDVVPEDLVGFTQCHFFAGIGVWSYGLRLAGFPDDRPVWTGSCPCQPFSAIGRQEGVTDKRHLWPAFFWLIKQCRPLLVLGEQVAAKAGESWFDLVRNDLETEDYSAGMSVFPACSVGAPHQRKRLYWMAYPNDKQSWCGGGTGSEGEAGTERRAGTRGRDQADVVADSERERVRVHDGAVRGPEGEDAGEGVQRERGRDDDRRGDEPGALADSSGTGLEGYPGDGNDSSEPGRVDPEETGSTSEGSGVGDLPCWEPCEMCDEYICNIHGVHAHECDCPGIDEWAEWDLYPYVSTVEEYRRATGRPGAVNGFWHSCDWLLCRDGNWRAVEPAYEQMVDGVALGMVYLRDECDTGQREIINATATNQYSGEIMRKMREGYAPEALWLQVGGQVGFHAASILFAAMLQQQGKLGNLFDCSAQGIAEACREAMRGVRDTRVTACPPQGWQLPQQLADELADALCKLPQTDSLEELQSMNGAPMADGVTQRVAKLRGYGNALVAPQAKVFVQAVMDLLEEQV